MLTLFLTLSFNESKVEPLFQLRFTLYVPSWVSQLSMLFTRVSPPTMSDPLCENWLGSIPPGGPGPQQQSLHRVSLFQNLLKGAFGFLCYFYGTFIICLVFASKLTPQTSRFWRQRRGGEVALPLCPTVPISLKRVYLAIVTNQSSRDWVLAKHFHVPFV